MSSTSDSEYREACKSFVQTVLKRPSMFFQSLEELEAMMNGHAAAFDQLTELSLTELSLEEGFNRQFGDWLYKHKGLACPSGWACSIEEECKESGEDPVTVFGDYVSAFFDEWDSVGRAG